MPAEKIFSTTRAPMPQALLQSTLIENVQVVPVEPEVKPSKTCELFNAGVSENAGSTKSADPSCYDSLTVDVDRAV